MKQSHVSYEAYAGPMLRVFEGSAGGGVGMPADFYRYYKGAVADPERLRGNFLRLRRAFDLVGAKGRVLLDAGCGFGINAVWSVLLGAKHVYALDFDDEKCRGCQLLADLYGVSEGALTIVKGSALCMPFRDSSIDAIISFDCMEHFDDLQCFFQECVRVLRPEGKVYSRTGANALNLVMLYRLHRTHNSYEVREYIPRRRELIAKHYPELPEMSLQKLATRTRGLARDDIVKAAKFMIDMGQFPRVSFKAARSPDTGAWNERPINPYYACRLMKIVGLRPKVLRTRFFITGSNLRSIYNAVGKIISAFHPLSLLVSPSIEVIGENIENKS